MSGLAMLLERLAVEGLVHLWQTTLVWIALFALAPAIRSAPARAQHAFWSIGVLKLLMPVAAMTALVERLGWTPATPLPGGLDGAAMVLDPVRVGGVAPGSGPVLTLIGAAWIAGASVLVSRLARELRRSPAPALPRGGVLSRRLDAALRDTVVPRPAVRLTADREPARVTGLLRPRILVPAIAVSRLTAAELRAVLLHEECHRRRRDPLRNVALRVLAALLFFHPLFGLLHRRLRNTTELVCDAFALRARVDAPVLSLALARSIRLAAPVSTPLTAAGLGSRGTIAHRLDRLAHPGRYRLKPLHALVLITALLVAAASLTLAGCSSSSSPEQEAARTKGLALPPQDGPPSYAFDVPPKPVQPASPGYPDIARKAGVEAKVMVELTLSETGAVIGTRVVKAEQPDEPIHADAVRAIREAALDAARRWQFEPATKDGVPVKATIVVPFDFKLN